MYIRWYLPLTRVRLKVQVTIYTRRTRTRGVEMAKNVLVIGAPVGVKFPTIIRTARIRFRVIFNVIRYTSGNLKVRLARFLVFCRFDRDVVVLVTRL